MAFNIVEANVIGMRSYSFNGKDGEKVFMTSCFFTFPDKRYDGVASGHVNVSENKSIADGMRVGSKIKVVFYDGKWRYIEAM